MGGELEPGSYLGLYQPTLLVTPRALYNIIVQYAHINEVIKFGTIGVLTF